MTEESLNRGTVLNSRIKTLKYILESMEQQHDLCIHLHKNLGEDMCINDEVLISQVLRIIKMRKEELEKEFKEL